jgi:hypothetical protein
VACDLLSKAKMFFGGWESTTSGVAGYANTTASH